MAAAVQDSRGGAGRKLKNSLKKKKKMMKMVAKAVVSELEDENKDPDGLGGNVLGLNAGCGREGQAEFAGSRRCQCLCSELPELHQRAWHPEGHFGSMRRPTGSGVQGRDVVSCVSLHTFFR